MLYVLHGDDVVSAKSKLSSTITTLSLKRPNAEVFYVDDNNYSDNKIEELISAQGLFDLKYIVVLSRVMDKNNENNANYLNSVAKKMAKSENIFIFYEYFLTKKIAGNILTNAQKVQEFTLKQVIKKPPFNVFTLADAFGERDNKKAWIVYQKALSQNIEPEQIVGILFWQIKTLLTVLQKNCGGVNLKHNVISNSKRRLAKFTKDELVEKSRKLIDVYHDAHAGKITLEHGLELYLLEKI